SDKVETHLWDWAAGSVKSLSLPLKGARPFFSFSGNHAAFSADSKWIASGTNPLGVWETATGKEVRTFDTPAGQFLFSPDGKQLVTASMEPIGGKSESIIRLWDMSTGKEKAK